MSEMPSVFIRPSVAMESQIKFIATVLYNNIKPIILGKKECPFTLRKNINASYLASYVKKKFFEKEHNQKAFDDHSFEMAKNGKLSLLKLDNYNIEFVKELFVSALINTDKDREKKQIIQAALNVSEISDYFDYLRQIIVLSSVAGYSQSYNLFKETTKYKSLFNTNAYAGSVNINIDRKIDEFPFGFSVSDDTRFGILFSTETNKTMDLVRNPESSVQLNGDGVLVLNTNFHKRSMTIEQIEALQNYSQLSNSVIYEVELCFESISKEKKEWDLSSIQVSGLPFNFYLIDNGKKIKVEDDVFLSFFIKYLDLEQLCLRRFNIIEKDD